MTNESGPASGIIHRPDMTPAELGCCCAANAQAMPEGNLRDLLFDVARVLATNESGLREKIARVASPLERERFLSILGERLEAAFNAGTEWAQGFDSQLEAQSVLDMLSAAPVAHAGEVGLTSFPPDEQNDVTGSASHTPAAAPMGMEG